MKVFITFLFMLALGNAVFSQNDRVKKLEKEVEELKKMMEEQNRLHNEQIKKLQEQIQQLKQKQPDKVYSTSKSPEQADQLNEKIKRLEDEVRELNLKTSKKEEAMPFDLNALNPRITAFSNMVGRFDDRRVKGPEGDRVSNRFFLRSFELDFRAAVDPFADAVGIFVVEQETAEEFAAEVEESYIWLKKIPGVEEMPLGLKLQMGKFRPAFGVNNKIHMHDLPWTTRPLPVAWYLGREALDTIGEGGFSAIGANAEFFLPTIPKDATLTADIAIVNGGQPAIAEGNESNDPAFVGRLNWFHSLSESSDLSLGLSNYYGKNDPDGDFSSTLYGVDFMYKWKPLEHGEWKSFIFGGEALWGSIQQPGAKDIQPFGYYLYTQYQFDKPWYLGLRYDFARDTVDPDLNSKVVALYVSYYTTEFLRFRLGYEKHFSNFEPESNSILFELNWVFGSHPVEPYWVNK